MESVEKIEDPVKSRLLGSKSITLPPVWPDWLLEEIHKHPNWKFEYDASKDEILTPTDPYSKYKVRPIKYNLIYDLYKQGEASHWTAEELDLSQDIIDWKKILRESERNYIKKILIYFLSADSGVGENALNKFCRLFPHWNFNQFYLWQAFNESIHSETYAMLVETFIEDEDELKTAFDAIEKDPAVSAKAEMVINWVEDDTKSPHENLIAFGFTESVFFSGSFSSIGWIKQFRQAMERGLIWSNDKISTDEGLHCKGSFVIYSYLKDKLPAWRVYQIGAGFVEKEFIFIEKTLEVDLIGMNSSLLKQYIMFVADVTLRWFGYPALYKVKNPFPWMDKWSVDGITSFFEKRNSEYQLSGVITKKRKRPESGSLIHDKNQSKDEEDFTDFRIDINLDF